MKSFDSRTYSINDFVEWDTAGQLELNPTFQRRNVWSEKAKSYLMDTVVRGKPIPKFFIRQKLNVTTRTSVREVVDGQLSDKRARARAGQAAIRVDRKLISLGYFDDLNEAARVRRAAELTHFGEFAP